MSVHSPSDNEHVFRPLCLADHCPYTNWHNLIRDDAEIVRLHDELSTLHDPPHGWTNGSHAIPNPSGSTSGNPSGRDRLLGTTPLDFNFSNVPHQCGPGSSRKRTLPVVPLVRRFTVRRSTFRGFSPRVLFRLLHESFAEITELRLEKWMELYADQQTEYRQGMHATMTRSCWMSRSRQPAEKTAPTMPSRSITF